MADIHSADNKNDKDVKGSVEVPSFKPHASNAIDEDDDPVSRIANDLDAGVDDSKDDDEDTTEPAAAPVKDTENEPEEAPTPAPAPHPLAPAQMIGGTGHAGRRRAKKLILWLIVILLAAAAGGAGVYAYYRKDINKKPTTVTVTKTITVPAKGNATPTVATRMMKFPTVGVQYPLDEKYDDFVLGEMPVASSGDVRVNITSRKLMAAQAKAFPTQDKGSNNCSLADAPLGSLVHVNKSNAPSDGPYSQSRIKQQITAGTAIDAGTYYIVYSTPQAACSNNKDVQQQATTLLQSQNLKDLLKSLKAYQAS